MSFEGKVIIITGAASGIGCGAALHLAKLGAHISLVDINEQLLHKVADQITDGGSPKPLAIVADITTDGERIISETITHFGRLDVLVNNAGIFRPDSVINFDADQFDRILRTNLKAAIVLTSLAVPHLEKTRGNVVNVSSIAAVKAFDIYLSYGVAKAGLNQFTKCAALALAPKGIRVNAINPGMIRTPIFETLGACNASNADQFFEDHKDDSLVGRVGEVADTSAAIAYLASESFVNGTEITVDGGLVCAGTRGQFNGYYRRLEDFFFQRNVYKCCLVFFHTDALERFNTSLK